MAVSIVVVVEGILHSSFAQLGTKQLVGRIKLVISKLKVQVEGEARHSYLDEVHYDFIT